ncbi:MAG TPA: hypothetical protein VNW47_04495 [Terriglobales bacterium]|nr:hypothetical protein [Terriglobales bacterium]
MTCTSVGNYTRACEFADGSAHVTTTIGDYYSATDYTAEQWAQERARLDAEDKAATEDRIRRGVERHGPVLDTKAKCMAVGGKWLSTDLPAPNQHRCKTK